MDKKDIRSLTQEQMTELAVRYGEKPFRGKQLFHWVHAKMVSDFSE